MKNLLTLIAVLLTVFSYAQSPEAISYQAVARDTSGNVLSNQPVSLRLSIRQGSVSGTVVYCETHAKTTNEFGLATLEIGGGAVVSGSFSAIDWGTSGYFLQTEMDMTGGNSWILMGISQLLSVPYAYYAKTSGDAIPVSASGQTLRSDGSTWTSTPAIYNNGTSAGIGTASPAPSSVLEVQSSSSGVLFPCMTFDQRNAIASPAEGLMVFCSNCGTNGSLSIFLNGSWTSFSPCSISTPVAGTNVASYPQVIWNWNMVPGATGYKWNTTNDYVTATDVLAAISKVEKGLTCNTAYTRYVWAYNECGVSSPLILTQSPFPCLVCGNPFTLNHEAGNVAPVIKTVTYGTVTNVPGETSKCWITRNLGADQQASAVSDATEASAGWYFQFNRKQGYKHDGTTRTPNTTWITSITESSDWVTTNDPCSNEFGNGWRIPTGSEWTNVNANGSWINWEWPFGSALKIHAAGYIWTDGTLSVRGSYGRYWSSTQSAAGTGWFLQFNASWCGVDNWIGKAAGLSLRCVNSGCTSAPPAPTSGTQVPSETQIAWNWNTVAGATGYKWNTTNDYATATDMVAATSKTENGLTCNTSYTRYVWAYNNCGYSGPLPLTQTTLACWSCGNPLTINHATGSVAPVTKTVTYGTVTNIPGATSKCWITSNLGSDHQATAVNDATEASAGWYWQFNRKQGYKHDGTTRTPNTTWIASISEDLDWQASSDPCTIELGSGWRIPTFAEWSNVNATGGWTDWNGAWNSALKMHATGYLNSSDGLLEGRGFNGYTWSSMRDADTNGWYLVFNNVGTSMSSSSKAYAFTLRCLKD